MKSLDLKWLNYNFEYPVSVEPSWKDLVGRWYQLDAYAYGLVEAVTRWQQKSLKKNPSLIILASPTASNETDRTFVEKGAISPSHFAHTLPNVRCSPLCQVLGWSGPILCIQRDPESQIQALKEGFELLGDEFPVIWILSVFKHEGHYQTHCFELSETGGNYGFHKTNASLLNTNMANKRKNDVDLLKWLGDSKGTSSLAFGVYEIARKDLS